MTCEWRPVEGFPGYEVSSEGQVQSLTRRNLQGAMRRGRILKQDDVRGYKLVRLARDGIKHARQVHRMVLEAFVGPCPAGYESRHLNSNPGDNREANLQWSTRKENHADKKARGTGAQGARNPKARFTSIDVERVRDLRCAGNSQQAIADWLGMDQTWVSAILRGKHWTQQLAA